MSRPFPISILFIGLMLAGIWVSCSPKSPFSPQSIEGEKTIKHDENITTDEVWESDKNHIIASAISINQAVLRIKPGTTIQFEKNTSISINDNGGLIADGSEQPIIFSSDTTDKGEWQYIYFSDEARDDSCQLINCQIEYGGGDLARGAIIHCDNSSPTITGCTISNSRSSGVNLIGDCSSIKFHDNTISNCEARPVQTYAINAPSIGPNVYRDNRINEIRIIEGHVTSNGTWKNPGIPYRIADALEIKNAQLTINPAVKLIFDRDEGATISDGGSIQAVGTPSETIAFSRAFSGNWKGIHFTATANDVNSKLTHCTIEYGGQDNNFPANIVLQDAFPEISSCRIHHSTGYGIYITGRIRPGKLNNNTITNNAYAPISVSANGVYGLSAGSYVGNGMDMIEVRGLPFEDPIIVDGYWNNLGVPYRIIGTIQIQASTLILIPGITIQMAERSDFEVSVQGGLIADGSSQQIAIQGVQSTSGIWNSIYFSNLANASHCQLINCRISYGGGDLNRPGMIYCNNISPIIRNCIIENSQTYGIYLNGNAEIADLLSNWFNGNGYGNYFKSP